ncbi:MAG: SusC/RagA family TonB-linked outer membrane protein [Tannerellaceae bacterium]|jgi:TonB-linked SusC/RagA family outer membrane protein|nr:SusC/RagA family TonB-linked outer membrane protein [Tannerellaceae bacterium]
MKKFVLAAIMYCCSQVLFAQVRITGTIADGNKEPVTGATVHVKDDPAKGVISDVDGHFEMEVPSENATLLVRYLGFRDKEVWVGGRSHLSVTLQEETITLQETVVTALGVVKEKKILGYSVQEVKGADIATSRDANPFATLTGKISGLRVAPSTDLLKSPEIYLRGQKPLIVVDGVPVASDTWNISPDDIENISILKGPTASALYGSYGKNGAVQITTKRAGDTAGKATVEVSSSTQVQTGYLVIPKVQNEYGTGYDYQYSFGDGEKGNINGVNNSDADIWGPRFEGQLIKQYDSPIDPVTGIRTPTPWIARGANNLTNFLETGFVTTNNVSIASKSDKSDVRISLSDTYQKGSIPNTKLNSLNVNITGGVDISKRLRAEAVINYNRTASPNYPDLVYNPRSPIYTILIWGSANYDIRDLRNYWKPGQEGIQQNSYDYAQYNNMYFQAYENLRGHYKDDTHGNVSLKWRITPDVDVRLRSNVSLYSLNKDERYPLSISVYDMNFKFVGGYEETNEHYWDSNTDVLFNYAKQLSPGFGLKASLGGSLRTIRQNQSWDATRGGLIAPGIYTLQNSAEQRSGTSSRWEKQVASAYGYADMDFKNVLFLSLTGRVDKSSTLPVDNNTYFYPSASLSAVVTDIVDLSSVFSFLRVRASYARVGGDLEPYQLSTTYSQGTLWDKKMPFYYSNTSVDQNIKPEFSSSSETGIDMRFFHNRLGVDFAYFIAKDGPQIFDLQTPSSSGVSLRKVNGLTYTRKGYEVTLTAQAVKRKDFDWDITANLSSSHRWLDKIYGNLENLGYIKLGQRADELWVEDFLRDPQGNIIYQNGMPLRDPIKKYWGNSDNDFTFGLSNTLRYKAFSVNIAIDGASGGMIENYTWENLWRGGRHEASANEHRYNDWVAYKNDPDGWGSRYTGQFIGEGVVVTGGELKRDPDGNVISDNRTFAPNTVPVIYQNWAGSARGYYRTQSVRMQDRSYLKLREITLTWKLPKSLLSKVPAVNAASISLIGRNLLYFTKADYIDLDQFTGSETVLQTPSLRSYGVNLNIII